MTERFYARRPAVAGWVALILAAWTLPAQASFDAFIRFLDPVGGATKYQGESTDQQFPGKEGWSEIYSFSHGIFRAIVATDDGQSTMRAQFEPFNFMKETDAGSAALFRACASGGHYRTAELALRKSGLDHPLKPFYRATLKNPFIASQQWSGSSGGDDVPTESVSVQFEALQWTYNLYDDKGGLASTTVHWDILADTGGFGPLPGSLPEIHCPPSDIVVDTAPGTCSAVVFFEVIASNDAGNVPVVCQPPAGSTFNKGTTPVNCTATDADGFSVSCAFHVIVNDAEAPLITGASVDKPALWPPDHKMRDVTVNYTATDNCGSVTTSLSIASNEPETGLASGDVGPDFLVIDSHHVQLRAERGNSKAGRAYTITITAVDPAGHQTVKTVTVAVPHSQASAK